MSAYEVGVAWEDASWGERRQNGGEESAGRESRLWRRRVDSDCKKRREELQGRRAGEETNREVWEEEKLVEPLAN
jgi:hypothetical protein